jgi:hypothetical protein
MSSSITIMTIVLKDRNGGCHGGSRHCAGQPHRGNCLDNHGSCFPRPALANNSVALGVGTGTCFITRSGRFTKVIDYLRSGCNMR